MPIKETEIAAASVATPAANKKTLFLDTDGEFKTKDESGTVAGLTGAAGATGDPGEGVPTGGTAGQYLRKTSGTDYATAFAAIAQSEVTNLVTDLAAKAPLASPTFTGTVTIPDDPYDATGWNGNLTPPTKNAVRDKIESLGGGGDLDDLGDVDTTGVADDDVLGYDSGTSTWTPRAPGGSGGTHAYHTYLAAMLEPLAIEKINRGLFSYSIGSGDTKLMVYGWGFRLGANGRMDLRDVSQPLPLRNITVTGIDATYSMGIFIDPALATYTDARDTYFDRLLALANATPLYVAITAPSTLHVLLPGPYGSILKHQSTFDFTWIGYTTDAGTTTVPISNEIGDGSGDYQRITQNAPLPFSKNICAGIFTGVERTAGVGKGAIVYINCPSSWGEVADPNTYIFRDDFMGASLDTATVWARAQSTAGNIEIETAAGTANWCKVTGNGSWGANGVRSQTTTSRAAGKIFECDVYTGTGVGSSSPFAPNLIVGWNNGSGVTDAHFAHGLDFTTSGGVLRLFVFEDGNNRGQVGSGFTLNTMYRVRITLGTSSATYEIQGGTYGAIGGSSWTNVTPGVTSSTTTPLAAGFTQQVASTTYVGDVRVY